MSISAFVRYEMGMDRRPHPSFAAQAGGFVILALAWLILVVGVLSAFAFAGGLGEGDGDGDGLSVSQIRMLVGFGALLQGIVLWGLLLAFKGILDLLTAQYEELRRQGETASAADDRDALTVTDLVREVVVIKRQTAGMADTLQEILDQTRPDAESDHRA